MTRSARMFLAAAAVVAAVAPMAAVQGASASTTDTRRLAGADRYATSAAVSRYVSERAGDFDWGPVYVASGQSFPDGLAAGAEAGSYKGRLLLTAKDVLPQATRAEVSRLAPSSVMVVGGTGVVSSQTEAQLKSLTDYVFRIAGDDRYETAASVGFGATSDTAFVAVGSNFPDALTGGAAAAHLEAPLLLTARSTLPSATADALSYGKASTIVVLGGPGVVNDSVLTALRKVKPNARVIRAYGSTRYDTAAAVSRFAYPTGASTVYLASGVTYADALSASAAAGGEQAPLLLSAPNCVPKATLAEINRLRATKFVAVGGTGVLSQAVIDRVPC